MKSFNITGKCIPEKHYMVDISSRLGQITSMVDAGSYFCINRGRQYGKTTTLSLLKKYLDTDYTVCSISFEGVEEEAFSDADQLARLFIGLIVDTVYYGETAGLSDTVTSILEKRLEQPSKITMRELGNLISSLSSQTEKKLVLMIDEVDQASGYPTFIIFLGLLRDKYLKREDRPTFHSVILASVYDIKNLKLRMRTEGEHVFNSPWNIAVDFDTDMSFSVKDIMTLLEDYENEHHTGMDMFSMASLLYEYTSGYPFLVSRMCQLIDIVSKGNPWNRDMLLEAEKIILSEKNTLFDDIIKKLHDYPDLKQMLREILYNGRKIAYNPDITAINIAQMFNYITNQHGIVEISNRLFETRLYNMFVSEENLNSQIYKAGSMDKNQFIHDGKLDMERILERFIVHYTDIYGNREERFHENEGRKYFLFYLKPIINGTGNYYIEAQTRDETRTDVIVDYLGEQYIIEMKIWHGDAYNRRGEQQLAEYMEYYHLDKGYMLSFNFNQKKTIGIAHIRLQDKLLVEAVV